MRRINLKVLIRSFCGLMILAVACIDPIDFEVPAGLSNSIVLQGRVVKGDSSYVELNVSRLFDFSPESRQPVSVRKVTFFDDRNNEMILETRTPGVYRQTLDETTPIQAEIGTGYRLRVETFDNRIYESTSDIMPSNGAPESLNVSITQELIPDLLGNFEPVDRVRLGINASIDNEADGGIYWEINTIYQITDSGINDPDGIVKTCYLNKTADVNEIYVLDPEELQGGRIEDFELAVTPIDFRFGEGLYYEVKQFSLSPGAFSYWNGIDILSEREGNMFDGPVGEVPTNFVNINDPDDFVFGYFFASEESIARVRVDPSVTGPVRTLCPSSSPCFAGPGGDCICGLCCDCLIDESSTTERPSFWID